MSHIPVVTGIESLYDFTTAIAAVGSRITCDPAPTDTDQDVLVLLPPDAKEFYEHINCLGYVFGGSVIDDLWNRVPKEDRFRSYRKGEINLIVTASGSFYRRFLAASSVAKRLNLLSKDDRIALFQAVLYGNNTSDLF